MKNILLAIAVTFCFASISCSDKTKELPPPQGGGDDDDEKKEYALVWQDEFNENIKEDGTYPLPNDEWWFETGNSGWGNNEPQYYVDREHNGQRVAEIIDGNLVITAHKLKTPLEGSPYISARMNTVKAWKYGKFEMRAKLPGGKGVWPAFWMLPKDFQSWPLDGEIDIMEYVGYDPGVVHASVHTEAYNHKVGTQKTSTRKVADAETEFHIYAIEWTEDTITGYIDGSPYFTFTNDKKGDKKTWPFDQEFYLKLNLAVGGDWGGAQGIDDTIFPAKYYVDYVRVYQLK